MIAGVNTAQSRHPPIVLLNAALQAIGDPVAIRTRYVCCASSTATHTHVAQFTKALERTSAVHASAPRAALTGRGLAGRTTSLGTLADGSIDFI